MQEQEGGTVPKEWVYNQYVAFCKEHGLRIKEKTIFAKMFYQIFPHVTSRRIGSGRNLRGCYLGVTIKKEPDKIEKGATIATRKRKKQEDEEEEEEEQEEEGEEAEEILFAAKTQGDSNIEQKQIKEEHEGGSPSSRKRKRFGIFDSDTAQKEKRATEYHDAGEGDREYPDHGLPAEHINEGDYGNAVLYLGNCLLVYFYLVFNLDFLQTQQNYR